MVLINNTLFFILIKSTGNKIGDTGATSLSRALKSNTTLSQLNLGCEYKRSNTCKMMYLPCLEAKAR